jgi:hypothetical protein
VNREVGVGVVVVVIHDQNRGGDENIFFELNPVLGGNHGPPPNPTAFSQNDRWFSLCIHVCHIEPNVRREIDRALNQNSFRYRTFDFTGVIDRNPSAKNRKRVRGTQPGSVQSCQHPTDPGQRICTGQLCGMTCYVLIAHLVDQRSAAHDYAKFAKLWDFQSSIETVSIFGNHGDLLNAAP